MGIAAHTQQPGPDPRAEWPSAWFNAGVAACAIVFVCGVALIVAACTSSSPELGASATPGAGSVEGTSVTAQPSEGQIDLPDQTLNFAVSTCTVLSDSFIAAGSGQTVDGEPFFVKIESPDAMAIRFGVDSEDAEQPEDSSLYRAVEPGRLTGVNSEIEGTVRIADVTLAPDDEFDASVRITCL